MRIRNVDEVRRLLVEDPRRSVLDEHIWECIAEKGALLKGHFTLWGGAHSEYFLRFSQIGGDRAATRKIARMLVRTAQFPVKGNTFLCSEASGLFLGAALAEECQSDLAITTIDGHRLPADALRMGRLGAHQNVIVVNDVIWSGETARRLVERARKSGSRVTGILTFAALEPMRFTQRLTDWGLKNGNWLLSGTWPTYSRTENCPGCAEAGMPIPASELI
jgi:orotate phosphoribosyltransferase